MQPQWGCNFVVAEMTIAGLLRGQFFARLQWGRNFIVAEMRAGQCQRRCHQIASMRPQLYRCGNVVGLSNVCRGCPGFNEAAALSLRKSANPGMFWGIVLMLQWGRSFIVAEIDADIIDLYAATMLQWDRNFIVAETSAPMTNARAKLVSLQWGRNFIVAEIGGSRLG